MAATRARNRLVVSTRESNKNKNPWSDFQSALENAPALDHGPLDRHWSGSGSARSTAGTHGPSELAAAWRAVCEKQYTVRQAKQVALAGSMAVPGATGEHGTEWGSAVHALLEAGAINPGADLMLLAHRILDPGKIEPW